MNTTEAASRIAKLMRQIDELQSENRELEVTIQRLILKNRKLEEEIIDIKKGKFSDTW